MIDIGKSEFAAGLAFVAISRVSALKNILFRPFFHLRDSNGSKLAREYKRDWKKRNV